MRRNKKILTLQKSIKSLISISYRRLICIILFANVICSSVSAAAIAANRRLGNDSLYTGEKIESDRRNYTIALFNSHGFGAPSSHVQGLQWHQNVNGNDDPSHASSSSLYTEVVFPNAVAPGQGALAPEPPAQNTPILSYDASSIYSSITRRPPPFTLAPLTTSTDWTGAESNEIDETPLQYFEDNSNIWSSDSHEGEVIVVPDEVSSNGDNNLVEYGNFSSSYYPTSILDFLSPSSSSSSHNQSAVDSGPPYSIPADQAGYSYWLTPSSFSDVVGDSATEAAANFSHLQEHNHGVHSSAEHSQSTASVAETPNEGHAQVMSSPLAQLQSAAPSNTVGVLVPVAGGSVLVPAAAEYTRFYIGYKLWYSAVVFLVWHALVNLVYYLSLISRHYSQFGHQLQLAAAATATNDAAARNAAGHLCPLDVIDHNANHTRRHSYSDGGGNNVNAATILASTTQRFGSSSETPIDMENTTSSSTVSPPSFSTSSSSGRELIPWRGRDNQTLLAMKVYYIPLYFSIYFTIYIGYLILKAIAAHRIQIPAPADVASNIHFIF